MKKISIALTFVILGLGLGLSAQAVCAPPPECEYSGTGTIGFWKNHPEIYTSYLPISLGSETVSTEPEADEVFDNASSDEMRDMLKAQLLAF